MTEGTWRCAVLAGCLSKVDAMIETEALNAGAIRLNSSTFYFFIPVIAALIFSIIVTTFS
jgi:hypothetical protein